MLPELIKDGSRAIRGKDEVHHVVHAAGIDFPGHARPGSQEGRQPLGALKLPVSEQRVTADDQLRYAWWLWATSSLMSA